MTNAQSSSGRPVSTVHLLPPPHHLIAPVYSTSRHPPPIPYHLLPPPPLETAPVLHPYPLITSPTHFLLPSLPLPAMYQQMNDGGHDIPFINRGPASSSFPSRPSCPCFPSRRLPVLFSSKFSLSFLFSLSLLLLSLILTLTSTFTADFIRMSFLGGHVQVWIGAWRLCQANGASVDCSSLSIHDLQVLGDSVAYDGFRAFLLSAVIVGATAALAATVRLLLQVQGKKSIPRWADVVLLVLLVSTAASQLLAFALFLDAYRVFSQTAYGGPQMSGKTYGSSFSCLIVAFVVQCVAVIAHATTWHYYANTPSGPGYTGGASQLQAQVVLPPAAPAPPQAFNLPAPSQYSAALYAPPSAAGYPPAPAQYGQGVGEGRVASYLQAPSPFPAAYLQPTYSHYTPAIAALSSAAPPSSVVHYGQGAV